MQGESMGLYKYLLNLNNAMEYIMAKYPPIPNGNNIMYSTLFFDNYQWNVHFLFLGQTWNK